MSALPQSSPQTADWTPLVRDLRREHGFEPLAVEGTLPAELSGTLFRNGPGNFTAGTTRYDHLFDGDGAISAVRLDGGQARGAVRFVDTEGRRAEQALGRPRYAGFGTVSRRPVFDFFFGEPRNAANTSVLPWQGKLLALWEGGHPTELDPTTLSTVGLTDLGGVIGGGFSAHPHRVPSRQSWFNFGIRVGRVTDLDLFQLPDVGAAKKLTTVRIGASMLHDFAVTERWAVFLISPLRMRPLDFLLGRASYVDALDWRPERGTEVVLVALDSPHTVQRFTVDAFYQWHFANAFDDGGRVVLDFVRYPDFDSERWLRSIYAGQVDRQANGVPVRATLDPARRSLEVQTLWDRPAEFPVCDGRFEASRTHVLWTGAHSSTDAAASTPIDRLARIDLDSGAVTETDLGPGTFPSEPVFVPRGPAEGDGWLLTVAYDAVSERSFFAVLDAETLIESGRAWFDQPLPQTFHGRWAD